MARKFNNSQPANKKPSNSYKDTPPTRGSNRIQKDSKGSNVNPKIREQKPLVSNPPAMSQKVISPPPPPPVAISKPLTQASKNNLAKLASINKLMGGGMMGGGDLTASSGVKIGKQVQMVGAVGRNLIKKPSAQQIGQVFQSLKDLQKLLDSYEQLQMDKTCNIKSLLEYLQTKSIPELQPLQTIQPQ